MIIPAFCPALSVSSSLLVERVSKQPDTGVNKQPEGQLVSDTVPPPGLHVQALSAWHTNVPVHCPMQVSAEYAEVAAMCSMKKRASVTTVPIGYLIILFQNNCICKVERMVWEELLCCFGKEINRVIYDNGAGPLQLMCRCVYCDHHYCASTAKGVIL